MKRIFKVEVDKQDVVFFLNGGGVRVYKTNLKRTATIKKDPRSHVTQVYRTLYILNR